MSQQDVALFVTCLVDLVRPELGFDVVQVLEEAGYKVVVPQGQTCCGQPNYNSGDADGARATARHTIDVLADYRYVVVPSGSCGGMISHHYPKLLADDPVYGPRARSLAERVFELSRFLLDVADYQPARQTRGRVTYHDACAGLRELGIKEGPRELLRRAGYEVVESSQAETCCGFGGTFCVKYPDISASMATKKVDDALASGCDCVSLGDLGCLLNIEGRAHRENKQLKVRHFVELLSGRE